MSNPGGGLQKEKILLQLKEKEEELTQAQREVSKLNKRLLIERINKRSEQESENRISPVIETFTLSHVLDELEMSADVDYPIFIVKNKFDKIASQLPRRYIGDLEKNGLFDGGLTTEGARFIKRISKKRSA